MKKYFGVYAVRGDEKELCEYDEATGAHNAVFTSMAAAKSKADCTRNYWYELGVKKWNYVAEQVPPGQRVLDRDTDQIVTTE